MAFALRHAPPHRPASGHAVGGLLGMGTRLVLLVAAAGTSVLLMRPDLVVPNGAASVAATEDEYTPTMLDFFWNARGADIDEIEVHRTGMPLVRLREMAGKWCVLHGADWMPLGPDRAALLLSDAKGRDEVGRGDNGKGLTGQFQGANPANHDRSFSIGDGMGTRVRFLKQGDTVEDLVLGRTIARAEGPATFVRRHGHDEVYLVDGDLTDNFRAATTDEWLMGRVFAGLDPDAVQRVTVKWTEGDHDGRYTLEREGAAWSVETGGQRSPARRSIVEGVLASLAAMESMGVLEDQPVAAAGAVASVRVESNDGSGARVLLLGPADADSIGQHQATISGSPHAFGVLRPYALLRDGREFIDTRTVAGADGVAQNRLAKP